jgi:hypothetical protein
MHIDFNTIMPNNSFDVAMNKSECINFFSTSLWAFFLKYYFHFFFLLISIVCVLYLLIDYQFCEYQVSFEKHRIAVFMINSSIHKGMWPDEIQNSVGQTGSVVDASTWPGIGYFGVEYWQPGGVWCGLFFEFAYKLQISIINSIMFK